MDRLEAFRVLFACLLKLEFHCFRLCRLDSMHAEVSSQVCLHANGWRVAEGG